MVTRREDSIQELNKRKTNEQLSQENAELRARLESLDGQLTQAQIALCELFEISVGGEA